MEINGSVALVTGGASGLDEAPARHLHTGGATVVVFDRDELRGEALAAELDDRFAFVGGDAMSESDVTAACATASEFGPLRILVACAGGVTHSERTLRRDGTPHDLAFFQQTVDLNLVGTFNSVRFAAAAKAGIIGTRAWDGAPAGVREGLEAKVPFPHRLGHPEEFAALAEHLITNRYLNGHVARLDGAIRFDPK